MFADPRLNSSGDYDLPGQPPLGATVALPFATNGPQPSFQVPTHTTELRASQSSRIPYGYTVK